MLNKKWARSKGEDKKGKKTKGSWGYSRLGGGVIFTLEKDSEFR